MVPYLTYGQFDAVGSDRKKSCRYAFAIDGISYFLGECSDDEDIPDTFWEKIQTIRGLNCEISRFAGVTGYQLYNWYQSRKFCPSCGKKMEHSKKERMMKCPGCGQMEYPKISPAVIAAVTKGDQILLTKYAGREYTRYALVAGFAEIGETIEETVHREVMEETGIRVKNLRYYKSQPWSFSDTLLFGFFAEADGEDEICLDREELALAEWVNREEVPEDDGVSLTREMMRVFKEGKPVSE